MKVTTEELERCQVLVTVEIEPQQEKKMLEKAAKRIAREVRIPGFRPGKAPFNVVVRRFGMEAIQQEALEQTVDQMLQDALQEADVVPYAKIDLESVDWDPLRVKVKVPTKPRVELNDYQDIRLEIVPIEVTDEDVEEALQNLQEQTATWAPVERASQLGDLISMKVVEKDGETVLAEHESVEHELDDPTRHEGHNHPDLTTPLLGLSAGDEKIFTLPYPAEFGDERYAGKDITFEVEILGVKTKELDPIDDEFAKSVSDFDTLEALKTDIRENIRRQRENQQNIELGNKALDKIIEEAQIEWPLAFEEESIDEEIERQERQLKNYGLTLDSYLNMQNKTQDQLRDEIREEVVGRLKRGLVLGKIAEREELDVSEGEILEQAKLIADITGRGEQVWRNILASEAQQSAIANDLLVNKAIRWLAAIAKGEDPNLALEDEESADADKESQEDKKATAGSAPAEVEPEQSKENTAEAGEEQPENESAETAAATKA